MKNNTHIDDEIQQEYISNSVFIPGPKHCEETKKQISESNKAFYKTEKGLEKRKAIGEYKA